MLQMNNKIVLSLLLFAFVACENPSDKAKNSQNEQKIDPNQADQISKNFQVKFIDSNHVKAFLSAKIARIYFAKQETYLDSNVKVDFFSKGSTRRISYLTADSCIVDEKTKNMIALGRVVLTSDSTHSVLKTSRLEWNNQTQRIFTNKRFSFSNPDEYLEGYGFASDQMLDNYTITKVSGQRFK
jgi:LPS export ABC transporter protein LptC